MKSGPRRSMVGQQPSRSKRDRPKHKPDRGRWFGSQIQFKKLAKKNPSEQEGFFGGGCEAANQLPWQLAGRYFDEMVVPVPPQSQMTCPVTVENAPTIVRVLKEAGKAVVSPCAVMTIVPSVTGVDCV